MRVAIVSSLAEVDRLVQLAEDLLVVARVTKADGSQVDVQLDRGFNLVGESEDGESQDVGH
jgi:hypothetical protein